jgi:hypothetical protein
MNSETQDGISIISYVEHDASKEVHQRSEQGESIQKAHWDNAPVELAASSTLSIQEGSRSGDNNDEGL